MIRPTRIHHMALATRDVEATVDFYARGLEMPLVHTENHRSGTGWFRHFFDMGGGEYLGFFAFAGVGEAPDYRTDISTGLGLPVWVNHVAFNLESLEALEQKKQRCLANGLRLHMEADHGWCRSIYFVDPNGIMVEFTTTTRPEAFGMTEAEALRRLRLPPAEFPEAGRKDASAVVRMGPRS
jgi:glyoxylase I family protein